MAKKLLIACNLLIVLILFSSASSFWEGASSADMSSTLPERGIYVASSSFPRHTVVDIVNLETGKTIQAIVVDNYSSPGNAVVLSRDAAEALGMGNRSSVRVRISLPSDSEAFSPFADGRSFSGDPDYDPKAFVRENTLPKETQAIVSPLARRDERYPSTPPPVTIIPDPVKVPVQIAPAPVEAVPEAPKTEMAQADLPSTTYPLLPPTEPMPFFMPPPLPTAVFVEDENPTIEMAQELPSEPAQLEMPSTVTPAPSAPELSMFIPMPLPTISAFEESPEIVQETASDFEAPELPEISETPYELSSVGELAALPYPGTPDYVLVPELEPESPFPDLSPMYPNPDGGNSSPYTALNEVALDKIDDVLRQDDALAEGLPPELTLPGLMPDEDETILSLDELSGERLAIGNAGEDGYIFDGELPPELTLPGQSPYEDETILSLDELSGERLAAGEDGYIFDGELPPELTLPGQSPYEDETILSLEELSGEKLAAGEDGYIFDGELPPELTLPGQSPYEDESIGDLADIIEGMSDNPDTITYQNPSETYIPAGISLDEPNIGNEFTGGVSKDSEETAGELGSAEASLVYAEPGMRGIIELEDGLWLLKNPTGPDYVMGDALPPEIADPLIAPESKSEEDLYDAIFRGGEEIAAGNAEASPAYAEPGMEGTVYLLDGRWMLRDTDGEEYIVSSELPPEEVLALIEKGERSIVLLSEALFREEGEIAAGNAEASPAYAEPGMEGTIYLVEGRWVLRDSVDNTGYLLPVPYESRIGELPEVLLRLGEAGEGVIIEDAETGLPYVEPGIHGRIELVDRYWVIKDSDDAEYIVPFLNETELVRLLPEARIKEEEGELESAEATLVYAEPGISGIIKLEDGRWILRDYADVEYILPATETDLVSLLLPNYIDRDSVEAGLLYAKPGMEGTIELIDGRWILRDYANVEYVLETPYSADLVRLLPPAYIDNAETTLVYAEPNETGISLLTEINSKQVENTDAASEPGNLIYILTSEPQFVDRATVNLVPDMPYTTDGTPEFNVVFDGDEAAIRNIYDTIVSIESAPNRPPEVIVDIGQIREEQDTNVLYLLPESADTKNSRTASLLLIKHLANDKYYLQIGLFDRKDVLARELPNLNWAYPYSLETSGNPQSPMYKLLVGPVNEGESNALLLRFKRYGYNDAFIRKEG
jgi:hypothetical protein